MSKHIDGIYRRKYSAEYLMMLNKLWEWRLKDILYGGVR